jgi:hypothetical protein
LPSDALPAPSWRAVLLLDIRSASEQESCAAGIKRYAGRDGMPLACDSSRYGCRTPLAIIAMLALRSLASMRLTRGSGHVVHA